MTPDEEYEFYARPENQEPQGPVRRRLTATVPVRFPPEVLEQVRALNLNPLYRAFDNEVFSIISSLKRR